MMEKSYLEAAFKNVEDNLKYIRNDVANAAIRVGRNPSDIRLMAVTKTVEAPFINKAIECGIDLIGENRVQEFLDKKDKLKLENVEAHLIGHLQTNKVRQIVGNVQMIQAVDSVKIAREIAKQSALLGITTNVLLEINIGGEESKFGFTVEDVRAELENIAQLNGIKVCGLMTVPPISQDASEIRPFFSDMRKLFIDIDSKKIDNVSMNVLSMGMSGDYVQAVMEGATLIRVGSAIFGDRTYR